MKIADFYESKEEKKVLCRLCPHNCLINPGKSGICGARKNNDGVLYSLNYGVISGLSFDPIEKKPLYHYYPSSEILSIGTVGCNMHCPFCQNHHISRFFDDQNRSIDDTSKPGDILSALEGRRKKGPENVFSGAAYTYSEPLVWFEFVMETASLLKERNYKNVLVTNGFISRGPLAELLPLTDAANIDLKAFTEEHYRRLGGRLKPVLDSIGAFKKAGVHIELTTLVVTGLNDNLDELENLVKWIAELDKSIPYHISRYFPQYRYNERATDIQFMNRAKEMADGYLDYVYTGNIHGESGSACPQCKNVLVKREGYYTKITGIKDGHCSVCGRKADFIL